jgi:hypothetical protein
VVVEQSVLCVSVLFSTSLFTSRSFIPGGKVVVEHYGCGHESSHESSAIVAKTNRQSSGTGSSVLPRVGTVSRGGPGCGVGNDPGLHPFAGSLQRQAEVSRSHAFAHPFTILVGSRPSSLRRRSTPSSYERLNVLESSLSKCLDTIARQNDQLATQVATLDRLFKAQANHEEIQTSTYEVADSVLSKLGLSATGKMSWLDIKPLPKSERRRILREHGGTFKTFPPDLVMLASTKALRLVQDAKVTLPNFATQEVAKFMTRNTGTIKMCGTVLSRVRELKSDLTAPPEEDGEDEDDEVLSPRLSSSVSSDVLLEFLTVLELAAEGSLDLAIDRQTLMRMSVSRRIETALGVAHLQQDPMKRPKEDFISPKTLTLIEDAAKMREDLTWAMEARKVATGRRSFSFGGRPRKSPGGGQRNPIAHGRGQGRGTGNHTSGKGKGKPKKVKWDADKEPNGTTDE